MAMISRSQNLLFMFIKKANIPTPRDEPLIEGV
jgi:hypothetical protein